MTSTTHERCDGILMTKLKGHQGSILCLDLSLPTKNDPDDNDQLTKSKSSSTSTTSLSSTTSLLLSGSEDHTARLWDIREHRRRACLCVQTSGDVLSAMFAPPPNRLHMDQPTTTDNNMKQKRPLSSPFALDYTIYLAVDNTVLEYDLRQTQAPIVRHDAACGTVLQHHQDEVNQISLAYGCIQQNQQPKGGKHRPKKGGTNRKAQSNSIDTLTNYNNSNSLYLAACDDAGMVHFVDVLNATTATTTTTTTTTTSSTILHHDSEGIAVVPTCAIRPRLYLQKNNKAAARATGLELASGGSDCKIHLWDLSKPKCVWKMIA
jgi:WD40 repeat protein